MIRALLGYALAVPVLTWWLVGDLTHPAARQLAAEGVPLDYYIRPPGLSTGQQTAIGVTALLVTAATAAVMISSLVRRTAPVTLWLMVLLPLTAAGVIVGFTWRVWTAGSVGANIGAGLMLLFGLPMAGGMLLLAGLAGVGIAKRRRDRA